MKIHQLSDLMAQIPILEVAVMVVPKCEHLRLSQLPTDTLCTYNKLWSIHTSIIDPPSLCNNFFHTVIDRKKLLFGNQSNFLERWRYYNPLEASHHFKAGTVCFSNGSCKSAPRILAGVRIVSRRFAIIKDRLYSPTPLEIFAPLKGNYTYKVSLNFSVLFKWITEWYRVGEHWKHW